MNHNLLGGDVLLPLSLLAPPRSKHFGSKVSRLSQNHTSKPSSSLSMFVGCGKVFFDAQKGLWWWIKICQSKRDQTSASLILYFVSTLYPVASWIFTLLSTKPRRLWLLNSDLNLLNDMLLEPSFTLQIAGQVAWNQPVESYAVSKKHWEQGRRSYWSASETTSFISVVHLETS